MTTTRDIAEAESRSAELAGIVVYGVVENDGRKRSFTEVDGVELVPSGGIAAVVREVDSSQVADRRAEVRAYSAILDEVAVREPVVPVRFGSVMPDRETVASELLAPQEAYLHELLQELRGRSQFNVRAVYDEEVVLAEVVASDPEIAELRARTRDVPADVGQAERVRLGELVARAMEHKRGHDGALLLEAVHPYVAAQTIREGNSLDHMLEASFLVDDSCRDDFEEALEAVAEAAHGRARIQLRGPLAPYDFVGG